MGVRRGSHRGWPCSPMRFGEPAGGRCVHLRPESAREILSATGQTVRTPARTEPVFFVIEVDQPGWSIRPAVSGLPVTPPSRALGRRGRETSRPPLRPAQGGPTQNLETWAGQLSSTSSPTCTPSSAPQIAGLLILTTGFTRADAPIASLLVAAPDDQGQGSNWSVSPAGSSWRAATQGAPTPRTVRTAILGRNRRPGRRPRAACLGRVTSRLPGLVRARRGPRTTPRLATTAEQTLGNRSWPPGFDIRHTTLPGGPPRAGGRHRGPPLRRPPICPTAQLTRGPPSAWTFVPNRKRSNTDVSITHSGASRLHGPAQEGSHDRCRLPRPNPDQHREAPEQTDRSDHPKPTAHRVLHLPGTRRTVPWPYEASASLILLVARARANSTGVPRSTAGTAPWYLAIAQHGLPGPVPAGHGRPLRPPQPDDTDGVLPRLPPNWSTGQQAVLGHKLHGRRPSRSPRSPGTAAALRPWARTGTADTTNSAHAPRSPHGWSCSPAARRCPIGVLDDLPGKPCCVRAPPGQLVGLTETQSGAWPGLCTASRRLRQPHGPAPLIVAVSRSGTDRPGQGPGHAGTRVAADPDGTSRNAGLPAVGGIDDRPRRRLLSWWQRTRMGDRASTSGPRPRRDGSSTPWSHRPIGRSRS